MQSALVADTVLTFL